MSCKHGLVVPPFDAQGAVPEVLYFWWSWHPNYPYWSRYGTIGCRTQEQAWEQRCQSINSILDVYHNKLVREGDGTFTVVADDPCRKPEVWRAIKKGSGVAVGKD